MRIVAVLAALIGGAVLAFSTLTMNAPRPAPSIAASSEGNGRATASPGGPAGPALPTAPPTPLPSGYTFYDDFTGQALSDVWIQHFNFDGIENTWSSSQAAVRDGLLAITANRVEGGWVSQLLDTKTTWTQLYGRFEARMKIPLGRGLWPAFWSYRAGGGSEAEIDTVEVCANPLGTNGGNDASLLHNVVRWTGGHDGADSRVEDLSLDFHVYGVDWRPDHVAFFLDGREVWRFDEPAFIPHEPLPLIVNLAVGGDWCGPSDATTPDGSALLVDWIRATR